MITYEEAIQRILSLPFDPGVEEVPLLQAERRILAAGIPAPWPMPRFDNSAMDGFAMRAAEVTPDAPMAIVGESAAGIPHTGAIPPGAVIRVSTGAEIPAGLDAVIPIENASVEGDNATFSAAPMPDQNIRRRGSDVAEGAALFRAGVRITPEVLAFLASYNLPSVSVFRRPRVAILTSGEEIVPYGTALTPAHIVGSSLYYLERELQACGCDAWIEGIARDEVGACAEMLGRAIEKADFIVSTAGVSVGEHDVLGPAIERLGGRVHFWKVKVRPGKPMLVATYGKVIHFGLPGNPVSTCCNTEIFIKPFLRNAFRMKEILLGALRCRLLEPCPRDRGRLFFVYGSVSIQENEAVFRPFPNQNSGNMLNPAMANGLAVVSPGEAPHAAGDFVSVLPLRPAL